MIVERLVVGLLGVNCYIVGCPETRDCAVIDPGGDAEEIIARVEELLLTPVWIVDTHGHGDHIGGQAALKERYPDARIAIHEADAPALTDARLNLSLAFGVAFASPPAERILYDGDDLKVGELHLKVLHVPGHTPGGIALYADAEASGNGHPVLICGDTLFAGSIGRADLPGGDMAQLLNSIRQSLLILPPETVCHTGHGEATTIGQEKQSNPFLQ